MLALQTRKSLRWVADSLGHSGPALALRVDAHAMREEETDLSFAEFGGSERLYTAPGSGGEPGARTPHPHGPEQGARPLPAR